ncbi:hypothetical protein J6590_000542 [Homalodisca vitripennis]|nr:hypothetical protein J6590_000542 [Homalodisca vitripennis]
MIGSQAHIESKGGERERALTVEVGSVTLYVNKCRDLAVTLSGVSIRLRPGRDNPDSRAAVLRGEKAG